MGKSIEDLRDEYKELMAAKKEQEERKKLEQDIKALKEEGTLKSRVKSGLKKAFFGTREHLRKKGQEFRETGERQQATGFGNNIVEMSRQSNFGTPQSVLEGDMKSPLYKQLTAQEKKKVKK